MEFWLGTINTVILLCSSLTVALSVHAAQLGHTKVTAILLIITVLMGFGFLGIKAVEYHNHWVEGSFPARSGIWTRPGCTEMTSTPPNSSSSFIS